MPRLAANLSFLFKERPFVQRFAAAARSGFKAVEFMMAGDNGYELTVGEVKDFDTALRIIEKVDSPHVKLQFDLFHYAKLEGSDTAFLMDGMRKLVPLCDHIQIANPPDRHEPGVGTVDYPPLLAMLDEELGYEGHVGCEYKPAAPSSEESLEWARKLGYL